jgi:hypothetical protein
MAPVSIPDLSVPALHGADGPGVVAIDAEDQPLFDGFNSYGDLLAEVGDTHSLTLDNTYDARVTSVGRLKPESARAAAMSVEEAEDARLVFAKLTKDSAGGFTGCVLFAGYLSQKGTVAEARLSERGQFMPVVQIRDWHRVHWEVHLLDRDGSGATKADTDLNVIRRRILRGLLEMRGREVESGWGILAPQPRVHLGPRGGRDSDDDSDE